MRKFFKVPSLQTEMKYVAFLRAINVGSHIVKMDQLRDIFETMDFDNVETFIASGNVIFDSRNKSPALLEKKIGTQLQQALGYEVKTFIRTLEELADVTRQLKSKDTGQQGNIIYVGFMAVTPDKILIKKLQQMSDKINDFRVHNREAYWLRRTSLGDSQYSMALIEKTLKTPITFRNVTTVRKILTKYAS